MRPGVLALDTGGFGAFLQEAGVIADQDRVLGADGLHDEVTDVVTDRVLVPVGEVEQALDTVRAELADLLGRRPAVLLLQRRPRAARRAYLDANAAPREGRKGKRKITSAATMHRVNATLSSFLGIGIKRGEYSTNWAQLVELPAAKRPKPLVYPRERVEQWRQTGEKPGPVMVWTPEQTGQFLDFVSDDRLYPFGAHLHLSRPSTR